MVADSPPRWRDRRHRGLFWTGLLVSVVLIITGAAYAYAGYRGSQGADGAVRGYLHALARGDASGALAYGDLPAGSQSFLTSEVLHDQLKLAPIRDIAIGNDASSTGGTQVSFSYALAFGRGDKRVTDSVTVRKVNGRWRLARVAATVQVSMQQAEDRATLAGAAFPSGDLLLFPGALPVLFDTPFLRLTLDTDDLQLSQSGGLELDTELTPAARSAIDHQLAVMLSACAKGGDAAWARCPLPSSQVVPGSMSGTLTTEASSLNLSVDSTSSGQISIDGEASFSGTYKILDFNDVAHSHTGKLTVPISASAYPVSPLSINFEVA